MHCKGTDYTVDTVPERAVVQAYGGRTAIVGDPKRHATRDLVARISASGPEAATAVTSSNPVRRVLIVRLGALGDIVHAIPVAAALRRAWPDARIDWMVSAKHREILELVPAIDRRLVVNDRGDSGGGADAAPGDSRRAPARRTT